MLRSLRKIIGYTMRAIDGEMGRIGDLFFDDHTWTIRYFIIDTGKWFPGRHVLVAPSSIGEPDWETGTVPINHTMEEIRNSPGIEQDLPVSARERIDHDRYYIWAPFWTPIGSEVGGTAFAPVLENRLEERPEKMNPRLRSVLEVFGYRLWTADDGIGHVTDLIGESGEWIIRYIIAGTRNWLPGRRVLISPSWVKNVDWANSSVEVELTKQQVKNSPEYDPAEPINREYEDKLYDYYGRPKYWHKGAAERRR